MTDDIPDDVVERALAEGFRMPASEARYLPYAHTMRAALRVAVEWEREQCALAAEAMPLFAGSRTMRLMEEATIRDAAAAIRARKEKQG